MKGRRIKRLLKQDKEYLLREAVASQNFFAYEEYEIQEVNPTL